MAPEVIRQSGHTRFSDIWSLGCTVYEIINKNPPWSGEEQMKLLNTIAFATKPPTYPKGISKELVDFLNCCF